MRMIWLASAPPASRFHRTLNRRPSWRASVIGVETCASLALMAFTSSLRSELWDENIRLSSVIPGIVATPMWDKAGGAPDFAITPEESALGILQGVAANQRIIILMEYDLNSAKCGFLPEYGDQMPKCWRWLGSGAAATLRRFSGRLEF